MIYSLCLTAIRVRIQKVKIPVYFPHSVIFSKAQHSYSVRNMIQLIYTKTFCQLCPRGKDFKTHFFKTGLWHLCCLYYKHFIVNTAMLIFS